MLPLLFPMQPQGQFRFHQELLLFEIITEVKIVRKSEKWRVLHFTMTTLLSPWLKPQHFPHPQIPALHRSWKKQLFLSYHAYSPLKQGPHPVETSVENTAIENNHYLFLLPLEKGITETRKRVLVACPCIKGAPNPEITMSIEAMDSQGYHRVFVLGRLEIIDFNSLTLLMRKWSPEKKTVTCLKSNTSSQMYHRDQMLSSGTHRRIY